MKKSFKELMLNEGIFDEEPKRLSEEESTELLDSIRTYNTYGKSVYREGNLVDVAKKVGRIAEYAEKFITESDGDWFDHVTIKRNMKELKGLAGSFHKVASEQQQSQDRMVGLYEDMGNLLGRYFDIDDLQEMDPHPERNGLEVGDRVNVDMASARKHNPRPSFMRKVKDQVKMGAGTVRVNKFEGKMVSISGGDVSVMNEIQLPVHTLKKRVVVTERVIDEGSLPSGWKQVRGLDKWRHEKTGFAISIEKTFGQFDVVGQKDGKPSTAIGDAYGNKDDAIDAAEYIIKKDYPKGAK